MPGLQAWKTAEAVRHALSVVLALVATHGISRAEGLEFRGAGFLTLAAGKVMSGTHDPSTDQGWQCPCFVADYAQAGIYESGAWRVGPVSKLGLQGSASIEDGRYAITGQVVSRGARDGRVNLEWLYATAQLGQHLGQDWTLQLGRKRLPLFLSSEVQDVGFSLPWIHLPPQMYGWEAVNFNGISLQARGSWGAWQSEVQLFGGNERLRDSGIPQLSNGKGTRTDVRWSDIRGGVFKLSNDWFEARVMLLNSGASQRNVSAGEAAFSTSTPQRIRGLSLSADNGSWFGRAELVHINRRADYGVDQANLFAVGRRLGPWQAVISYSHFRQRLNADLRALGDGEEQHASTAIALKYELNGSSAVKLQFDRWHDRTTPTISVPYGNANLVSVAYELVF